MAAVRFARSTRGILKRERGATGYDIEIYNAGVLASVNDGVSLDLASNADCDLRDCRRSAHSVAIVP
jgi:hypothetical protein